MLNLVCLCLLVFHFKPWIFSLLIKSHRYPFTLGTFYHPLNSDTALSFLKEQISSLSPRLILVGDFNVDFLKSFSLVLSNNLHDLTNHLGLKQIICEPTHFSHISSPSFIHYVFVPSDLSCPSYVLPPISLSDHLSFLFSIPLAQGIKYSLQGSIDVVKRGSTIRPTSILPFLSSQGQSFVFIVN